MNKFFRIAQALLLIGASHLLAAQDTLFPFQLLQQYPEEAVFKLETDLTAIRNNRFSREWHEGALSIYSGDSVLRRFDVQVQVRGKMRRQTCSYPPLKIRFLPLPSDITMAGHHELKMVWTCKDTPNDDQWVLKEALMYELYNILTDQSYRIKKTQLTIVDRSKWGWEDSGPAFFIEPDVELADRLGGTIYKPRVMAVEGLQANPYDLLCVFQFMIGNTDWSAHNSHNVRLVAYKDRLPIAVPYDFDYSGAIGTNYAVPSESVPIRSVEDRYYLGLCREDGAYQPTIDLFIQKKADLMRRCEQYPGLTRRSRNELIFYLQSFFEVLENPKRTRREIVEHCNKRKH